MRPGSVPDGEPKDLYSEFESLETIQAIVLGLEDRGHTVHLVDSQANPLQKLELLRPNLDLVLNTSVGLGCRFRELMPAALCEALGIPYTGGDPMAQALAANKHVTKLVAQAERIATPAWSILYEEGDLLAGTLGHDVVLKPVFEGSSIGVGGPFRPAIDFESFRTAALQRLKDYRQPIMIEEFIGGYELTVCLLGNPPRPLPPLGLFLDGSFNLGSRIFDAATKADAPNGVWRSDPPVPGHVLSTIQNWAMRIHKAIGCRDLSRSDFRVSTLFKPFFVEINATPQIAPFGSSFSAAAAAAGIGFESLLETVVLTAIGRCRPSQ